MRGKPEILAPAGSIKGMKAAIAAGCDAVYMGGSRFGARAYAENPKEDEMLEAIAYCHLHGVKLYMTVNTLLKGREMEDSLFSFLRPYYEVGLDAVIVQDVGVLRFVSRHFPKLEIHASTQMTLTMGKELSELERYHVTRMVPARELTLEELVQLRKDTGLELEVFVHGALCYCYSGQCLFSSMFGGRSGNRGRCAQPCRMPYQIEGKKAEGDYLLSPMELCNLSYLPEMIEAGIDSFKIEGRMKRPEYTAFVTSIYRKYVDLYFELGSEKYHEYLKQHDKEWQEDLRCLGELYNRSGFTQGYLEGKSGEIVNRSFDKKGEMLSSLRPKHGGICVGKVLSVGKHEVIYQTSKKLSAQDVVEFRDEKQQPSYEYTLGSDIAAGRKVTARYQKGCRIKPGDAVYRTKDAALLTRIRENYLEKEHKLAVSGVFTAVADEPMRFVVYRKDACGKVAFAIECAGDICQKAKKQPATKEAVCKTLNQTGNSSFYFEELEIQLEGELFLPVGALKKLRREALEQLEREIVESFCRKDTIEYSLVKEEVWSERIAAEEPVISASVMLTEQLDAVLAKETVSIVYLHTEVMNEGELLESFEKIIATGKKAWLILPNIFRKSIWEMFEKELVREKGIFSLHWDGYLIKNMESLHFLLKEAGISKDRIRLDHNMYLMNQEAYEFWMEQGIEWFTLPLEVTEKEMEQFSFLSQTELFVYGKLPLMVSAQCITANTEGCKGNDRALRNHGITFTNQKKQEFEAVNYCKYCYNVIYQKKPLYIKELVEKNERLSSVQRRYSFTTESGSETAKVLEGSFEVKTQLGHFKLGIE